MTIAGLGNIVGRNALMAAATADDGVAARRRCRAARRRGCRAGASTSSESDHQVAAVGFAQANVDGTAWPRDDAAGTRTVAAVRCRHSSGSRISSIAPSFIDLGGYRESFVFYGEEKEYCLRLLDRGYRVVYLPDALVVHAQDAAGRTPQRYLRYVTRNDCLHALYNEPIWRAVWLRAGADCVLYFQNAIASGALHDPAGLQMDLSELAGERRHPRFDRGDRCRGRRVHAWRRLRDDSGAVSLQLASRPIPAGNAD